MGTNKILEPEKVSALLANFTRILSGSPWACLIDTEGGMMGCHPATSPGIGTPQLRAAFARVQQQGRLTSLPIGAAAPVRARGELVGALIVAAAHTLQPHETAALQLLSRVLSLVIESNLAQKDLLQETIGRYREINLLYRMGETIASSLDINEVNQLVLDESIRLIKAHEGAVMLLDKESEQLTVWASRGLDAVKEIGAGIPLGHELAKQVVRSGKTQIFERPKSEIGQRENPITELLCVPLKSKDGVMGVISLAHTHPDRVFRANDVKLLNAIAGSAAIAIDHALMFSDLSTLHIELEEANQRMLELDRLKSSFLGVITHELRSPVANLDFSVQVIERYGIEKWHREQREQWEQLTRLLDKAKEMIDNLVSFAGLLSKQGDLFLTPVDISTLTHDVTATLLPVAQTRQIKLHVEKAQAIPLLLADEMRLAEAIYHLIHNAIKFNRPDGTVEVRYWLEGKHVKLQVRDTGIGIPADKLESLGNPFAQLADPLKRGLEGLGLGLALVKYVVHAHGGQLEMSSQEGHGSTFEMWLPFNEA